VPFVDEGWADPSAGLYSSITDQAKLILAIDRPRRIFEDPTAANLDFLHPQVLNNDGTTGFGFGWQTFRSNDYLVLYKGGAFPGYRSVIAYIPDIRVGFAMLSNGGVVETVGNDWTALVADTFLPALRQHLMSRHLPVLPPNPEQFIGQYDSGFNITMVNGVLYWSLCNFLQTGECSSILWNPLTYMPIDMMPTVIPMQIISMPNTTLSCMREATSSFISEWIYFSVPVTGQPATQLTIPGLWPQKKFLRLMPKAEM